jgi:Glycosyl hydrolase 108
MCSFGSGTSGPSAPTTQVTSQTTTASPQAQAMYNQAWQAASAAAARPFQAYSYDPNAFVAPLNAVQQQAIGDISSYQGTADPYYQAGAGLVQGAAQANPAQLAQQYMSPYMSQVVNPVQQAIQQQQGQQLAQQQAEAIQGGAFGGERAQLQRAQLMGQQNLGLGQALSPLYQTGYGQALGAAQTQVGQQLAAGQALGQLGTGQQQAGLAGAQALLGAGTLGQQTQQAGLQALYNQYMLQQQYPFMTAQFLTQAAGGLGPGYGGTTSGVQQSFQPLSYWGNPLSDPHLKTGADGDGEPEVIGHTKDGQKIYRYRLINPDTGELGPAQIGLMADEVEEKRPDAIGDYKGYKTVDYAKATDEAARMGGGVKGPGDYADGGGIEDIVKSQEDMYKPLSASASQGIVPTGQITQAHLDTPALSYATPQHKQQSSLAQGLEGALGLYKSGKEATGLAGEASDSLKAMNLGDTLGMGILPQSFTGAAAPAAAEAAAPAAAAGTGIIDSLLSLLPEGLMALSDPKLKTGVRPGYFLGAGVDGEDDTPSGFDDAVERTFKFEGGLNPNDAGKGPSMYGINQAAHPNIDVTKITPDEAKGIYKRDYWDAVNADKLPSNIREMVYDTAVMAGPRRANQLLEVSGQDPNRFMAAREKFLSNLIANDPDKYGKYAKSWASRNAALRGGDESGVVPLAFASKEGTDRGEGVDAISRATSGVRPTASAILHDQPEGISGFLRGTKPEGTGEKAMDFLTSERFIVPLLAGLGTMASSGSRFLGPSILQGIGGGAKAYSEMAQQQFEREKMAEQLGLQARETAVKEAALPLTERELNIKEQEAARKMRALQELAATAGKISPLPPSSTPTSPSVVPSAAPGAETTKAPAKEDFWSDVDPMMNPSKLLEMAQESERKASVAAQDFPEWSKMLNDQALKFRSAASDILKGGSVLKGGQMVPIPGSLETEKQKAQQEAETKAGMELVEVQPKAGGPVYKVPRKDAAAMTTTTPGAGTPPGAIIAKQPASAENQIEQVRKDEGAMLDQFKQRQVAKERMDALIDSLRVLETGKFAERKAEVVAGLRALGFDVPSTATANPEEFQKFIKNSTANIFDQVKAMGGKILVSEITGLTKANANPELQPGANAALIGQAKGLLDYEDQHFKDYRNWRKTNPDKYSVDELGDFETEWVKNNPLGKYAKEAEMSVGARGAPLLPADKREKGYTYTNDQGVTGRWNGTGWDIIGGPTK